MLKLKHLDAALRQEQMQDRVAARQQGDTMTTIHTQPPTPEEIMRATATWVARLYGVKIEFTIDDGRGDVGTTVIDRLSAPRPRVHACDVPGCVTCQNPERSEE